MSTDRLAATGGATGAADTTGVSIGRITAGAM